MGRATHHLLLEARMRGTGGTGGTGRRMLRAMFTLPATPPTPPTLLAQTPAPGSPTPESPAPGGQGPAPTPEAVDGATITIDPAATEGISVTTDGATDTAAGLGTPDGPVSQAISQNVPDTGLDSVDQAVDTLGNSVGSMVEGFIEMLPFLLIALIVLIITAILARLTSNLSKRAFAKVRFNQSLQDLFAQLIYIAIWFMGLMVAASIVFPGFGPAQLIATAGLASIAIGFAFQDIFSNFFAGVLILWRFPFTKGDFIEVPSADDLSGEVEDILIRMTLVRRTDGVLVLVPNNTIYSNPVRVLTNRPTRRITVPCGVAYAEDLGKARQVITDAVQGCKTVHQNKPVQIFLTGFGASSVDFEITWWTDPKPVEHRTSRDEVIEAVKNALDDAGIEIPYPYRTLTFSRNEPDIIEAVTRGRAAVAGRGKLTAEAHGFDPWAGATSDILPRTVYPVFLRMQGGIVMPESSTLAPPPPRSPGAPRSLMDRRRSYLPDLDEPVEVTGQAPLDPSQPPPAERESVGDPGRPTGRGGRRGLGPRHGRRTREEPRGSRGRGRPPRDQEP